ncbi:MAG: response regulator [Clostridiales bacterium]
MYRILVADDEESLRYLITETLKIDEKFDIYEAEDGEEALKMVDKYKPDLILLDIMMPKLTGYELAGILKDREYKPKIVILTAKSQKSDIEKGMKLGVDHYLTKPFSPIELLDLIEKIVNS